MSVTCQSCKTVEKVLISCYDPVHLLIKVELSTKPCQLVLTFVFLQWCASEAASCPRHKTLNEDINFGQHVTAPLKKHFVGRSFISRSHLSNSFCGTNPIVSQSRQLSPNLNLCRPFVDCRTCMGQR